MSLAAAWAASRSRSRPTLPVTRLPSGRTGQENQVASPDGGHVPTGGGHRFGQLDAELRQSRVNRGHRLVLPAARAPAGMACRGRSNDLDHRPHARMLRVGPVLQRRTPGEQSRRRHVGKSGQWREAARSAARVASSAAGVGVDWCSVRRFRLGSARERARRGIDAPARTSVSVSSAAVRHGAGHAVTRVRGRRRTGAAAPGGGGRAARARPVGHHVHAPAVLGQANTPRPTFAPGTRPTQDASSASCCGGEPLTPADPYSHTQRR